MPVSDDPAVRSGAVAPPEEEEAEVAGEQPPREGAAGPGKGTFRALGERERFAGSFLRLVTGTFVGPDGFIFDRDIVRHPGAVVIVPVEADGRHVLCIRQFRSAVGETLLELPAGKLDVPDEPPIECAARELAEEVGVRAGQLTELCSYYNSPGFSDERSYLYLAEGLEPCEREAHGVEESHISVESVDLGSLDELISTGQVVNGNAIIGLTLARETLRRRARSGGAAQQ
jgi:ADP-ribose pyrophosphatase